MIWKAWSCFQELHLFLPVFLAFCYDLTQPVSSSVILSLILQSTMVSPVVCVRYSVWCPSLCWRCLALCCHTGRCLSCLLGFDFCSSLLDQDDAWKVIAVMVSQFAPSARVIDARENSVTLSVSRSCGISFCSYHSFFFYFAGTGLVAQYTSLLSCFLQCACKVAEVRFSLPFTHSPSVSLTHTHTKREAMYIIKDRNTLFKANYLLI